MKAMARTFELTSDHSESYDDRLIAASLTQRSGVLANKLTNVLSASYADSEIRDALRHLDISDIQNTPENRRKIRLDVQKEVIDCNAGILDDFGAVAEVRPLTHRFVLPAEHSSAITADWFHDSKPQ